MNSDTYGISSWSKTAAANNAIPAVYGDWSVLTELFLGLVHLPNEVNEAFAHFGNSLFRPVRELELTDCPRLTILETANVPLSHPPTAVSRQFTNDFDNF